MSAAERIAEAARTPPEVERALTNPWYKDAIIYQLHVRTFRDSNNDGIGDFRGLTERLDYIQDLGVTAIWLLPFFPSPLKDDGYDIADYRSVNPQYGTLDDFRVFLDEAHRRDLRVITEFVMNHTSDQHEWFQRSRRAKPGSPWRDWYVWSDTPDKYPDARIIFQDFESSNWTWDPVAEAYFWHRFFSHQPDLNFDNPQVCAAMFEVLDYWLGMGVDGLRLDAIPYLFEREGTNCENLPETHALLRDLRAHIDAKYGDRMLLAEANQWPEDAAAYFGNGDECQMNFHFPLMPRLYMAVEREDGLPIVDILEQTPVLPPVCQWATFLRNHDELTLEMVTDEERDYMYRTYAVDAKARINLGIRRRLAPLMANDRRKIELMNVLLLSLPGTPIIYYGDEIGMGDNFYLGDRNGVRTPMHWSGDRNAGFSRANPQSLCLPVIIDPQYHYEFRNVEVEHANPHSLLWWMRRILDVRKRFPAFGNGRFEALSSSTPKVLAFLRETDTETLLVVANLSRLSQFVELDLSRYKSRTPTELFGRTSFPAIGDESYRLSLGPHGFFWFCIGCDETAETIDPGERLPMVRNSGDLDEFLSGRSRNVLRGALGPYLRRQRWFSGSARTLQAIDVTDSFDLGTPTTAPLRLLVISVAYAEGEPDAYVVPVTLLDEEAARKLTEEHPLSGILRIEVPGNKGALTLCEATWDKHFWTQLIAIIAGENRLRGNRGTMEGIATAAYSPLASAAGTSSSPVVHKGKQNNTLAAFDERFILKLFRRVTQGINPEFEIGCKLMQPDPLPIVPQVAGALEYVAESGRQMTFAVLHQFVPNVGDAWTHTLDELNRFFERVQSRGDSGFGVQGTDSGSESAPDDLAINESVVALSQRDPPPLAQEMIGGFLSWAELLGRRIGEMHVALAKADGGAAFSPQPFTRLYQRSLYQSMRSQARATLDLLRTQRHRLNNESQQQAQQVLARESTIYAVFGELLRQPIDAERIRCHGDLHLGQVLFTGKDFAIIDFEGESDRPVSERRIKASPLRDVASLLHSFQSAAQAALRGQASALIIHHTSTPIERWSSFWSAWISAAFLKSYLAAAADGGFLPNDRSQLQTVLGAYLLEKDVDELRDELNSRPDWVSTSLKRILQLCRGFAD